MKHTLSGISAISLLSLLATGGCSAPKDSDSSQVVTEGLNIYQDASQPVSARVADLLSRMSLDEKLGQMTQPDRLRGATGDRGTLEPAEITELRLGSMLSGGDMAPTPATPTGWADSYDMYQRAALATPLAIPMLYAVDAVHGAGPVIGATIFPHNIGLGSTRDPALVERIGRATAEEIAATGLDWTFSPCVAVTRDDHWGRVYESFGEVPEIPSSMTSLITGLQGTSLSNPTSVMATAKHYMGDGGTVGGVDEGETTLSEADLRAIHLPPFREAVRRNVAAVMVSYSSWNGTKMHANQFLVTGVLKGELGFQGIVITDWDAIELVDGNFGFSPEDVRASVNAGIDVFMITSQYRNFINLLRAEVQAGRVSMARIDDANRRILTKKFELGLFERPFADRSLLGTIGSAQHRALAREAVQKSQVVLKNDRNVLPLSRAVPKLFVAGKSADNIGFQSGGWTVKWQGGDGPIQPGTSILAGIRSTVSAGTQVNFDVNGNGVDNSYAAAIAVIGEKPYAEYEGDRKDDLKLDVADLAVLAKLKASGVPTVVVLVSGRPLDVSERVADWAGFVAAWLPGTEGQGVADVLFGVVAPSGKLPLTWLQNAAQEPINVGDGKPGLFPFGHGLTYPVAPGPTARDARATIRAESYTGQQGTQLEACSEVGCGSDVGWVSPGDFLYFDDVDFGASTPLSVEARVASGASSGTIEFRLDSSAGPVIAALPITSTGGWTTWASKSIPLTAQATGRHRLYSVFTGPSGDFVNLNWFRFSSDAPPTPGVDAASVIRAESYSGQQGTQLETCSEAGCGKDVGWLSPGDFLYFDDVNFGSSAPLSVEARVASGGSSGTIEFRLDTASGPVIAAIAVSPTGSWTTWATKSAQLTGQATGRHRLYTVFSGPGGDFVNLSWFRFLPSAVASTLAVDGVAPWRGGAAGAYSLIHDDVCHPTTLGVFSKAEPELTKRGLHAGFGVIVGLCDTPGGGTWNQVRLLQQHGHDVFSHSWDHPCMTVDNGLASACDPVAPRSIDFAKQIAQAHSVLQTNVSTKDDFFIFPYDVCDPAGIASLRGQGYLGARCGARRVNAPGDHDPFAVDFDVYGPSFSYWFGEVPCVTTRAGTPAVQWSTVPADYTDQCRRLVLDEHVDQAVRTGGWAMREFHGLDPVDPMAWEGVSVTDYTAHLDHLVAKVQSGELWVEGPSVVNRYQLARNAATCNLPTVVAPNTLHFAAPMASCARVATTLTYKLSVGGSTGALLSATQGGVAVTVRSVSPGRYLVDADPTKGDVVLSR